MSFATTIKILNNHLEKYSAKLMSTESSSWSCLLAICVFLSMGPGYSVDLVLNMDLLKDTIDVRKSIIYDVEGNNFVLSQTTPTIKKYDIGKFVHVTHLKRQGGEYVRHGFSGKLIETIKDYDLTFP